MMGLWDNDIDSILYGFSSNREAEKTNNYDKYNNEYKNTQRLIIQKKSSMDLVLKQDRFKTLKIKLEKIKKDM
jgi:hypothetical protein